MKTRYRTVENCSHPDLEYLGSNGDVRFLRCGDCRMVFALHDGEAWGIPPRGPRENDSELH